MTTVIISSDIVFKEFEDFYRISANVHGLTIRDIVVNVAVGLLTVSGLQADGRRAGSFLYNVDLPHDVDTQAVSGWLEHGVLTMIIGRAQECFI